MNLLQRADLTDVVPETRCLLKNAERSCGKCQDYAQRPCRSKFTLRDDREFNRSQYIDMVFIDGKPVLHAVVEARNSQAAEQFSGMPAETHQRILRTCSIDDILEPPEVILNDLGNNFVAAVFQANTDMLQIRTKSVPVKSSNSTTIVVRFNFLIRRSQNIIWKEHSFVGKNEVPRMNVNEINDYAGPDGLFPMLVVFVALLRLGLRTDGPLRTTTQRAVAL